MAELNITFSGACISLYDVVPGVPMRTVLPDASALRFGIIRIPRDDGELHNVNYYIMPHLATVRDRLTSGVMPCILNGCYMKILNAKPQPFCRKPGGYRLTEFAENVALSSDVVFRGNAAAYFDVFGGSVWTEGKGDEPRVTCVSIKTEGTPQISITPLPGTITPIETEALIQTNELYITNLDVGAPEEDAPFDFLLNYLVVEGGIPKQLTVRTPGMPPEPPALTLVRLGERIKALGTLIETGGTVTGWRRAIELRDEPGPSFADLATALTARTSAGSIGDNASLHQQFASTAIDPLPYNQSCSPSSFP